MWKKMELNQCFTKINGNLAMYCKECNDFVPVLVLCVDFSVSMKYRFLLYTHKESLVQTSGTRINVFDDPHLKETDESGRPFPNREHL
jgi:hypothetical protein